MTSERSTQLRMAERSPRSSWTRCRFGRGEADDPYVPSGSGKTTFLHEVAGITPVSSGEVWTGDNAVHSLPEPARDRLRGWEIGIVFQTFNLQTFPHQHATDLLARVGLGDRIGHRPDQLSSGQQKRLAIARALANGPSVVLADEPTAHVDETSASAVLDLLQSECAGRDAILAVPTMTHRSVSGSAGLFRFRAPSSRRTDMWLIACAEPQWPVIVSRR